MPIRVLQILKDHKDHLVRFRVLDQAGGAFEDEITNDLLTVAQLFYEMPQNGRKVFLERHELFAEQVCDNFDGRKWNFEVDIWDEFVDVCQESCRIFLLKLGLIWRCNLLREQLFNLFHRNSAIFPLVILI